MKRRTFLGILAGLTPAALLAKLAPKSEPVMRMPAAIGKTSLIVCGTREEADCVSRRRWGGRQPVCIGVQFDELRPPKGHRVVECIYSEEAPIREHPKFSPDWLVRPAFRGVTNFIRLVARYDLFDPAGEFVGQKFYR